ARVSDVAVPTAPLKDHLYTFYVSFWTGGLWKTTNNGTTFDPVFDNQGRFPIGDVTIAPSNPDIVWVGTGDAFTSRSSYAGDGVYKSVDGAKTWTKSLFISDRVGVIDLVMDPRNSQVLYAAAYDKQRLPWQ